MELNIDSLWRKFFNHGKMQAALSSHIRKGITTFLKLADKEKYIDIIKIYDDVSFKAAFSSQDELSPLGVLLRHKLQWNVTFPNQTIANPCSMMFFRKVLENSNRDNFAIKKNNGDPIILSIIDFHQFFSAAHILIEHRHSNAHTTISNNSAANALSVATSVITLFENSLFEHNEDDKNLLKNNALALIKVVIDQQEMTSDDDEEGDLIIANDEDLEQESILHDESRELIIDSIDKKLHLMGDQFDEKITHLESVFIEMSAESTEQIIDQILERMWLEKTVSNGIEASQEILMNQTALASENHEDKYQYSDSEDILLERSDDNGSSKLVQPDEVYLNEEQAKFELLTMQRLIKKRFECENWENISQGPFRDQIFKNKIRTKDNWLSNEFIIMRYNNHKDIMNEQINSKLGADYFRLLERINFSE